ncbi:ribbon-helix-helix protein, CopG family [Rothia nasimurium]|uniref:Ribbon-helix-helix protein, CopG family n=2 Tax=Rothia nasimurium TaxID=85336 RepID=A0A4Y9F486_9MICC|nr:ribbon-helix-helix protein, CopG family [Rothia nasimurium]
MCYTVTMSNTTVSTLNVRIPTSLKERLNAIAQKTDRSVSYHVKRVLEQNISDLEHAAHLHELVAAVKRGEERTYTPDELRQKLGI